MQHNFAQTSFKQIHIKIQSDWNKNKKKNSFIQSCCTFAFSYVFPQIHQQSWNKMKESSLKFYFMFEESITSAGFCSVCRETKGKCSSGGSADKGACRRHLYSWCLEWERSPQDALAPVCEDVDGLMKMSRFSCQIVWHLSSAPTVWDSGVGALVWRAALCDWQRGPVSVTEEESTSIFCFDRLQRGLDSLIQSFVWLKVLEPMGT